MPDHFLDTRRSARKTPRHIHGMIILDSGPLIALVVHKLGLGCSSAAPPELVDAVKKVEERLGLRLASLWPVATEALHILEQ